MEARRPPQPPPHDDYWNDPSPSFNPSNGSNTDTPDPNKFKVAGAILRYGSLQLKLLIDGLILKNAGAEVADIFGSLSTVIPLIDSQEILAGLLRLNNTNKGWLQAMLGYRDATISGWKPLGEFLGHLAVLGSVLFAAADLSGGQSDEAPKDI